MVLVLLAAAVALVAEVAGPPFPPGLMPLPPGQMGAAAAEVLVLALVEVLLRPMEAAASSSPDILATRSRPEELSPQGQGARPVIRCIRLAKTTGRHRSPSRISIRVFRRR